MPAAAAAGEGGVRLIRAAAEGRKSERDRASARAEAGRRDATRRTAPRCYELVATWRIGRSFVRSFVRARRGNAAARPSRTPADPTDTHGRTENGGPEKERIPFCRAGGDEKRRGENERARERERRTNGWQRRGRRGKGREDKRAERERVVEMKREREKESDPPRS